MKKQKLIITGVICSSILLAGCGASTKGLIVQEKAQAQIAEPVNTDLSQSKANTKNNSSIPKTATDRITSQTGDLKVEIAANVEVPEFKELPVYNVSEKAYDSAFINKVVDSFINKTKIYDDDDASLVKETLTMPKNGTSETYIAETENDSKYYLSLGNWEGLSIDINKLYPNMETEWLDYQVYRSSDRIEEDASKLTEDQVKKMTKIKRDEALKIAEEKVSTLGIEDMTMLDWDYSLMNTYSLTSDQEEKELQQAGYIFHFGRKINNLPITYTSNAGGALDNEYNETIETWCYENLDVIVSKDGIEKVTVGSLYNIDEKAVDNVQLKDFNEIMENFKNMMLISHQENAIAGSVLNYNIERITLGYMRIYDPFSNSKVGRLVPVWDFFGNFETYEDDGKTLAYRNLNKFQSHMTINAIDGTLIDRGWGFVK
jgi:outer membrane murein-binding lipoprotein Lpp